MSRVNCCVVGCSNSYKKCPAGTVFYSFPADIRFPGRKELWIRAVKRTTSDNKDWIPSKNARICCQHFIGGKRSDHPHHPNYIPSVFPKSYRKPAANPSKVSRFERTLKRGELKDKTDVLVNLNESTDTMEHDISNEIVGGSESSITHVSIGVNCCLTSDLPASEESNVAVLSCCIFDESASIQTFIPVTKILKDQVTQTSVLRKNVNPESEPEKETIEDFPTGFQGLDSVTSDEKLSAISGVSFAVFFVLLNIVKENLPLKAPKIQIEDRLLIFLMKMKLGISHFALAVIFGVHRTTVSRIFDQILDILVMKTLNWVYWPSKAKVRHTLPEAFKEKYRNCRAIIDCTEIKTECPTTVEQQVLMYSTYKGDYTVKYLIAITPSGFISFISNGYGGRAGGLFYH